VELVVDDIVELAGMPTALDWQGATVAVVLTVAVVEGATIPDTVMVHAVLAGTAFAEETVKLMFAFAVLPSRSTPLNEALPQALVEMLVEDVPRTTLLGVGVGVARPLGVGDGVGARVKLGSVIASVLPTLIGEVALNTYVIEVLPNVRVLDLSARDGTIASDVVTLMGDVVPLEALFTTTVYVELLANIGYGDVVMPLGVVSITSVKASSVAPPTVNSTRAALVPTCKNFAVNVVPVYTGVDDDAAVRLVTTPSRAPAVPVKYGNAKEMVSHRKSGRVREILKVIFADCDVKRCEAGMLMELVSTATALETPQNAADSVSTTAPDCAIGVASWLRLE
jgi:hypothetical protein